MRRLDIIRLLILSSVLFCSGLTIGWWVHLRWPLPEVIRPDSNRYPVTVTVAPLLAPESNPLPEIPGPHSDIPDYHQAMNEGRYDDALTIYQRHEGNDSPLTPTLRSALLDQMDQWDELKQYGFTIDLLERFTDYYYQDTELLKRLASAYEADQQIDKTIETYINTRTYTYQKDQLSLLNSRIHTLSEQLFEQQRREQNIETLIPLLQKLAWFEPDYAFYRYALAESYMAISDTDSAIRELEILQLDPDYGNRASRLLTALLPPPPPDEPEELANVIPLTGSGGHFVVNATIGDKYRVRLLIDTGSSVTTLPPKVLNELRRREIATRISHIELKTANGVRMAAVYRLKTFQIGQYSFSNLEVAELELNDAGTDGLLGMNVLSHFHFFINQNRQTLSLTPR